MADAAPRGRGGFGSRGDRGGDRRGRGRGRGRRGGKQEEKEWQPVTKLGRLVKAGKITSMEQIYLHSLPIKEYQIVDFFLPKLKDEVMKVRPRIGGLNRNCVQLKCMRNAIARTETITIPG
jgi:small subunit ribosomal protein S2e